MYMKFSKSSHTKICTDGAIYLKKLAPLRRSTLVEENIMQELKTKFGKLYRQAFGGCKFFSIGNKYDLYHLSMHFASTPENL
jgi:hypothetical protein